ncbi:hypothetical protein WICMUC_005346 [Wickerhamomyces mucosus]|uniref:poly(A)-specific ribonuclease n=1 Tax=Wickerhamomyces mucosus TaxID=1378264 RepID=A0A9P8P8Q6_9ASCO|nr:hypothetical protein WICMUC_005346 [Wickerhamomyces mucosus]
MSFLNIHSQNDLNQAAQLQKLSQLQQHQQQQAQQQSQAQQVQQQSQSQGQNFSPQITQRGVNPQFNILQQQAQQVNQLRQQQQVQQQLQQQQQQQQLQQQQLQQQLQAAQAQAAQSQQQHSISPQITVVKEVWNDNFQIEFQIIRQLITQYNYVSFSTEFPGILARPIGVFTSTNDYHYQTLRTNTDLLNLIQFGISLSDSQGKKPDNIHSTWQFNFKFDLETKMISNDAFESLSKTGIDFSKHQAFGIDQFDFAELLTSSGLVLLPNVYWTSFHAGYDFGFLISLLTNNLMPNNEEDFLKKVELFFPKLLDLKILSKSINLKDNSTKLSLENLADDLNIPKLNSFVSTGGQALLTNFCLIELKNRSNDINKHLGAIHGLGNENSTNPNNQLPESSNFSLSVPTPQQSGGLLNLKNSNNNHNSNSLAPAPPNLGNLNQFNQLLNSYEM